MGRYNKHRHRFTVERGGEGERGEEREDKTQRRGGECYDGGGGGRTTTTDTKTETNTYNATPPLPLPTPFAPRERQQRASEEAKRKKKQWILTCVRERDREKRQEGAERATPEETAKPRGERGERVLVPAQKATLSARRCGAVICLRTAECVQETAWDTGTEPMQLQRWTSNGNVHKGRRRARVFVYSEKNTP